MENVRVKVSVHMINKRKKSKRGALELSNKRFYFTGVRLTVKR